MTILILFLLLFGDLNDMYLLAEDSFCNKHVYNISDSVISIKDGRYVIYKGRKEIFNLRVDKTMITHDLSAIRQEMSGRYFTIERI